MSISLKTNLSAMQGVLDLNRNQAALFSAAEKLSSGLKINRASDNPAGLVISEQLRSSISALNGEIRNLNNNVFKYEFASSSIDGLRSQLNELRSLAVGAANAGGNTATMQAAFAETADITAAGFNHAVENATYNGARLFDGSAGSVGELPSLENIDLSSAESAQAAIATIDSTLARVNDLDVQLGATVKNQFASQLSSLETERQNLIAADSVIRDTDYALNISQLVRSRISVQVSSALLSHSNLNGRKVLGLLGNK